MCAGEPISVVILGGSVDIGADLDTSHDAFFVSVPAASHQQVLRLHSVACGHDVVCLLRCTSASGFRARFPRQTARSTSLSTLHALRLDRLTMQGALEQRTWMLLLMATQQAHMHAPCCCPSLRKRLTSYWVATQLPARPGAAGRR